MVRSKLQQRIDAIVTNGLLSFFSIIMLFPILYSFMTSFKSAENVITIPPTFFPVNWTLDGYRLATQGYLLNTYVPNSAINALAAAIISVTIATLASYVFSRYKFRGSQALEIAILALFMIPGLTNLVSYYRIGTELKILNTHTIIILVYAATELPFGIWVMRSFFDAIPVELEEAARVDGCTNVQALLKVTVPLAIPGIFTVFLLAVVYFWNEFLFAVTLLSNNAVRTAPVGLYDYQTTFEVSYHALNAASMIILIPMVILFIFGRKIFFRAMLEGALKG
ncbi:MAG: carbohydrate ABC transporter permease [Anaerolineae bacterium]|nr:carbohydrate ABC transporter permease [Anaerolineae bacterium]